MNPDLIVGAQIGSGGFGAVHHGHWKARKVAVKIFDLTKTEVQRENAIQAEIELLERLRDRHVIQFYGTDFYNDRLVLIMDFAEGGSLRAAIHERRLPDWATKIRIAQEIARGLAYIHYEDVLHRDLKSGNVLLTKYMEVKLCDFGLAKTKIASASNTSGSPKGTLRWIAPELFVTKPPYSTKSDIYSLGMVMWEMAAGRTTPFRDLREDIAMELIKSGQREKLPDNTPVEYRQWVERCWDHDPRKRPEACEMVAHDEMPPPPLSRAGSSAGDSVAGTSFGQVPTVDEPSSSPATGAAEAEDEDEVGKYPSMIQVLLTKAENNDSEAQVALAEMFGKGNVVRQRDSQAFFWYHRAAEQGKAEAQYQAGELLFHGRGVKQDYHKAAHWFRKAANKRHCVAQYNLGCMYEKGLGVQWSDYDALTWLRKSATQGYMSAQHHLGIKYEEGYGVEKNPAQAAGWYHKAAEQGSVDAQCRLAWMYLEGRGVEQDYSAALQWAKKGVEQGSPEAQFILGWMHELELGVPHDYVVAESWYRKGAEQGHANAQHQLGELLEKGRGVAKDLEQAVLWYRKAAEQKHPEAQEKLLYFLPHQLSHGNS